MEHRRIRKWFHGVEVLWIGVLLAVMIHTAEAYPIKLEISQIEAHLPEVRLYVGLLDEQDRPIQPLSETAITVNVDGTVCPVERVVSFEASGEGVAYTLLIDVSKTMRGAPFTQAIAAGENLIRKLRPQDRLAIITFGDRVTVETDFVNDQALLLAKLDEIEPTHDYTHFYAAVNQAYNINTRGGLDFPVRRAILVITDGKDEGSGITLDDLLRRNETEGIPIYSIGYSRIDPKFLDNLKRLSELSGGNYLQKKPEEFAEIYQQTIGDIHAQSVVTAAFPTGKADGKKHQVSVFYRKDSDYFSASKPVKFDPQAPVSPVPTPAPNLLDRLRNLWDTLRTRAGLEQVDTRTLMYIAGGGAGGLLLFILLWRALRKKPEVVDEPVPLEHIPEVDDEDDSQALPQALTTGESGQEPPELTIGVSDSSSQQATPPKTQEPPEACAELALTILKGSLAGDKQTIYAGKTGKTIGRESADIVIPDPEISKIHCSIRWSNERLILQDEGSSNGTFRNGIPVRTRDVLEDGDTIELGQSQIRVRVVRTP